MVEICGKSNIKIKVNGHNKSIAVRPSDTLLSVLREQLGLTKGCENIECEECTILVDGWPVKACFMLAVEAMGHNITTIEALKDEMSHNDFIDKLADKGDYCVPNLLMNNHALVKINPNPTDDVLNEWMESNICRRKISF